MIARAHVTVGMISGFGGYSMELYTHTRTISDDLGGGRKVEVFIHRHILHLFVYRFCLGFIVGLRTCAMYLCGKIMTWRIVMMVMVVVFAGGRDRGARNGRLHGSGTGRGLPPQVHPPHLQVGAS